VFQFFNLIPRFAAMDNVELSLAIANVSRSERKKRAAQLLETVGLKDRMKHKPAELSGGQQQRVAIARALANNPTFLLLDEPTGNIDSKTAHELMEIIKNLNAKGVTIIMVTHDQHLAREAKRTVQMMDGVIISDEVNMQ
jgi:putative ABC transport system ATP-binding protein